MADEKAQQPTSIFDVFEQQLDAVEAALNSARFTLKMMRDQATAAQRSREAQREPPRTFGRHRQESST